MSQSSPNEGSKRLSKRDKKKMSVRRLIRKLRGLQVPNQPPLNLNKKRQGLNHQLPPLLL